MSISGDILPSSNFSLGSTGTRWNNFYAGPGIINIAGSAGSSNNAAIIGSDNNSTLYSKYGFASPFVNIGPNADMLDPTSIGGWQLSPTGTLGITGYNLIAQQKLTTTGLTGPKYSLISSSFTRHEINSASYTILSSDSLLGVSYTATGAVTLNLPPAANSVFTNTILFIVEGGLSSSNNITINANGSDLILGSASYIINTNYMSVRLHSNGVSKWFIL
jgi:hypothetical protein